MCLKEYQLRTAVRAMVSTLINQSKPHLSIESRYAVWFVMSYPVSRLVKFSVINSSLVDRPCPYSIAPQHIDIRENDCFKISLEKKNQEGHTPMDMLPWYNLLRIIMFLVNFNIPWTTKNADRQRRNIHHLSQGLRQNHHRWHYCSSTEHDLSLAIDRSSERHKNRWGFPVDWTIENSGVARNLMGLHQSSRREEYTAEMVMGVAPTPSSLNRRAGRDISWLLLRSRLLRRLVGGWYRYKPCWPNMR